MRNFYYINKTNIYTKPEVYENKKRLNVRFFTLKRKKILYNSDVVNSFEMKTYSIKLVNIAKLNTAESLKYN